MTYFPLFQPPQNPRDHRADPQLRRGGQVRVHGGGRPREEEAEQDHPLPRGGQEDSDCDQGRGAQDPPRHPQEGKALHLMRMTDDDGLLKSMRSFREHAYNISTRFWDLLTLYYLNT